MTDEPYASDNIYLMEFFERGEDVALADFHATVKKAMDELERTYAPDKLGLLIGRSFRMGRLPEYIALWEMGDLNRLEARRDLLSEGGGAEARAEVARVSTVRYAGLYQDLGREFS